MNIRDPHSRVWKYSLVVTDTQVIEMPLGAEILTVQLQGKALCLWARVITSRAPEKRTIAIYGTGHEMFAGVDHAYIGTFQVDEGALVFHVFELKARA